MVNKLYWNSDDYVVELWGASTKHPDCVFHFKDYKKARYLMMIATISFSGCLK